MKIEETSEGARWLLLIHQLPTKPAYARVKIWRRLKGLGAVTVKNSVYALPSNAETREDFAWLIKEIAELGGEGFVCEATLVDGLNDSEVRALFSVARDEDYAEVAASARELAAKYSSSGRAELAGPVARLRRQLDEIIAIDFFGADGREPTEGLVSGLEAELQQEEEAVSAEDSEKPACRKVAGSRLGDTPGRADRSHCLSVADPSFHRRTSPLQVRAGHGLCRAAWRTALRHVRR